MSDAQADDLAKLLVRLTSQQTTVTARPQQIDVLHQFILNNVPYGLVDLANLKQGLIEIDGPAADSPPNADPQSTKPCLQWFFGGRPHAIPKAYHIQYTYKQYDITGGSADISASLFIGFEMNIPNVPKVKKPGNNDGIDSVTRLTASIQRQLADHSSSVIVVSDQLPDLGLDQYLKEKAPLVDPPFTIDLLKSAGDAIEMDGPAQDNDSHAPFTLGLTALFNDKEKFDRLLYWYFGGKPYRITKAIRIPYVRDGQNESLLIGYQGPPTGP